MSLEVADHVASHWSASANGLDAVNLSDIPNVLFPVVCLCLELQPLDRRRLVFGIRQRGRGCGPAVESTVEVDAELAVGGVEVEGWGAEIGKVVVAGKAKLGLLGADSHKVVRCWEGDIGGSGAREGGEVFGAGGCDAGDIVQICQGTSRGWRYAFRRTRVVLLGF